MAGTEQEAALTSAAENVDGLLEKMSDAERVLEAIQRLGADLDTRFTSGLDSLRGYIQEVVDELNSTRESIQRDLAFLMSAYELDEEARKLLTARSEQAGITLGQLLSQISTERLSWDPKEICSLLPADLSDEVRKVAHGRGVSERDIIANAVAFAIQCDSL